MNTAVFNIEQISRQVADGIESVSSSTRTIVFGNPSKAQEIKAVEKETAKSAKTNTEETDEESSSKWSFWK